MADVMDEDQRHSSQATTEEKFGMLYVYADKRTQETTNAMVGFPVTQETYDGMPDYMLCDFTRPNDEENAAIKLKKEFDDGAI